MQLNYLTERLKSAHESYSLRELAELLDVSHEQIRKVVKSKSKLNITFIIYDKIDQGLLRNGF
jgi:plasmid maintenance system antidote protein VapI